FRLPLQRGERAMGESGRVLRQAPGLRGAGEHRLLAVSHLALRRPGPRSRAPGRQVAPQLELAVPGWMGAYGVVALRVSAIRPRLLRELSAAPTGGRGWRARHGGLRRFTEAA